MYKPVQAISNLGVYMPLKLKKQKRQQWTPKACNPFGTMSIHPMAKPQVDRHGPIKCLIGSLDTCDTPKCYLKDIEHVPLPFPPTPNTQNRKNFL